MRLIDADNLGLTDFEIVMCDGDYKGAFELLLSKIENASTVDVMPVRHGHWIDDGQYADYHPHHEWCCSECGEHVIEIDKPWYKYCPNCGAKMDWEKENEANGKY